MGGRLFTLCKLTRTFKALFGVGLEALIHQPLILLKCVDFKRVATVFADLPEWSGVVLNGITPGDSRALPSVASTTADNLASALQQGTGVVEQVAGCGGASASSLSFHHDDETDCVDDAARDDTPPLYRGSAALWSDLGQLLTARVL